MWRRRGLAVDLAAAALLFGTALAVRWAFCRAMRFPPLDDPAFYLVTAKNLAAGRGLVVDALWSYHTLFPSVTHPSHEHWMPMATYLDAAAFVVERALRGGLHTSFGAAQIPGAVLGALLAPLTYLYGRRHLPGRSSGRWIAVGAALFVGVNATLGYQSASADSGAPFAFLAAAGLMVAAAPVTRGRSFATGALAGLAYLTRADGVLLVAAVCIVWVALLTGRDEGTSPRPVDLLLLVAGFGIAVAPWLVRNSLVFGTPLPGSLLAQAWLSDYAQTFNYQAQPTLPSLLAEGLDALLVLRWQALVNNGRVFLLNTFPWGLLALPGLWMLRRRAAFALPAVYALLLFFSTALIFPVSAMWGTFYHSFGALSPFLALAAVHAVSQATLRLRRARGHVREVATAAVLAGLVVLGAAQVVLALPMVESQHEGERARFEAVVRWLEEHAPADSVIMTTQPYTLNYVSGHPSIVLPAAEAPHAAWAAAERYGAQYLVVTQPFGQYPEVLHDSDPRFELVETVGATEIYRIRDGR